MEAEFGGVKFKGGKIFATNIKTDIRNMNNDIRHITEIVNDIEDRQKEDSRELLEELKIIEEELDLKINKALNNPLASMK